MVFTGSDIRIKYQGQALRVLILVALTFFPNIAWYELGDNGRAVHLFSPAAAMSKERLIIENRDLTRLQYTMNDGGNPERPHQHEIHR